MILPRLLCWGVLGLIAGSTWTDYQLAHAQQPTLTPPAPEINLTYSAEQGALVVKGWSEAELDALHTGGSDAYSDLLQVRVALPERDTYQLPSVVGTYEMVGDELHFYPRYGWSEGQRYEARLDLTLLSERTDHAASPDGATLETSFAIPARATSGDPPIVTAVYPSADVLPENLLRFYIEFSGPMQRGEVYNHVYLLDADGRRVDAPFLRIGQEFWSPDMTRLTLLLDPGRIKRGVAPNVQVGAPLGSSPLYELVIEADLKDADGRQARAYRKPFTVTEADRASPDPNLWQLPRPELGTQQPLVVKLDGVANPVITGHFIRVEDEQGKPVQGTLAFQDGERVLTFTPQRVWSAGSYRLAVHPSLEDYAGNRVSTVFDMEPGTVSALVSSDVRSEPIYRYFEIIRSN